MIGAAEEVESETECSSVGIFIYRTIEGPLDIGRLPSQNYSASLSLSDCQWLGSSMNSLFGPLERNYDCNLFPSRDHKQEINKPRGETWTWSLRNILNDFIFLLSFKLLFGDNSGQQVSILCRFFHKF